MLSVNMVINIVIDPIMLPKSGKNKVTVFKIPC